MIARASAAALLVLVTVLPSPLDSDPESAHPAGANSPRHPQAVSRSYTRSPLPVARPQSRTPRPVTGAGWVLTWTLKMQTCIRFRESTNRYTAVSPSGRYFGAYQFSDATWTAATGLRGHASDYSRTVQDAAFLSWFAGGKRRHEWTTFTPCRALLGGPA